MIDKDAKEALLAEFKKFLKALTEEDAKHGYRLDVEKGVFYFSTKQVQEQK